MTFDEACKMAETIRSHYRRLDVLAVGRFVAPDAIETTPERWGVSVRIDRGSTCKVLWSRDALLVFAVQSPAPKQATKRSKPAIEETGEMLLF